MSNWNVGGLAGVAFLISQYWNWQFYRNPDPITATLVVVFLLGTIPVGLSVYLVVRSRKRLLPSLVGMVVATLSYWPLLFMLWLWIIWSDPFYSP